jgi:glutamate/tyrosine decarboxylase-like PLP-dependent enzyme
LAYESDSRRVKIASTFSVQEIRGLLESIDFNKAIEPKQALEFALRILSQYQTHTAHPRYFGLFDPAPTTMGIIGDALVAVFNPQLSVWIQSPGPIEIERLLVREFGQKFGYDLAVTDGVFTSGGAEANHTALLNSLVHSFPEFVTQGLRALRSQPVMYVSAEGHHSIIKAARLCGLGTNAVREVSVDADLRMDPGILREQIGKDREMGFLPFLIVGTVGTTNAGAIDPLGSLADVAAQEKIWLHIDAAWGGAVALVPEQRHLLRGIERSDSITFDPHKWLSVPRGAGLYLTKHSEILEQTFNVSAAYMPVRPGVDEPFRRSMQWSRRFMGLKLFLSLSVAGWEGYAQAIGHQLAMSKYLCRALEQSGWTVLNDSSLAVVCFFDRTHSEGSSRAYLEAVCNAVVDSGEAWVSFTMLDKSRPAIRACVVNHRSREQDVDALIGVLDNARRRAVA